MPGSHLALSSRGLGRRPLTAVTRVRIPLGLPRKRLWYKGLRFRAGASLPNLCQSSSDELAEPGSGVGVAVRVHVDIARVRDRDVRVPEALADDLDWHPRLSEQ